ncbi:hypothetical protein ACFL60_07315 [Candidatus Omnitrophota bacterium]
MAKKSALIKFYTLFLTALISSPAFPTNSVQTEKFIVEPPTLVCAGFEWNIEGDDNRNASVEVSYRQKGTTAWKEALPLLRLHNEKIGDSLDYTVPNMFAGSIFNLSPGTEYECRFVMTDPDGVDGNATIIETVTTREEPNAGGGGRTLHVYPPGYEGEKEEPSFNSIMAAYYGSGKGLWGSAVIEPGDVILVHGGLYKSNRLRYYEPLGLHFHGYYYLTKSGTAEKPIVIRAAGDGEAIFDGDGVYRLFDVVYADHTYIEGLTIRNCDVAIMAGMKFSHGCDGLVVRNCRMEDVGCGVNGQYGGSKNFYIADNVMIGREDSTRTYGRSNNWKKYGPVADLSSFIAVDINGSGHVVCHNYFAYFHDAVDITEQGPPERDDWKVVSIDIYNNDIHHATDDFIEADCSVHNIRVFNNRGFNAPYHGLSAQPIYGGPTYFIRNIVYHVPNGGAFKFNNHPAGIYVFHNTLCSEWTTSGPFSNVHMRNNLILGTDIPKRPILRVQTYTSYTTFDYNGYRPNGNSETQFRWTAPGPDKIVDYDITKGGPSERFNTFDEFRSATGREEHGISVDYEIFRNVTMPDHEKPGALYRAQNFDFRLKPGSAAVDKGCILPNINDGFSGSAPDLGAYEVGLPLPVYGPRTGK